MHYIINNLYNMKENERKHPIFLCIKTFDKRNEILQTIF